MLLNANPRYNLDFINYRNNIRTIETKKERVRDLSLLRNQLFQLYVKF